MPIIAESVMARMPELLLDFHRSLQPEEYVESQNCVRLLWKEWITPHSFDTQLHRNSESIIVRPLGLGKSSRRPYYFQLRQHVGLLHMIDFGPTSGQ